MFVLYVTFFEGQADQRRRTSPEQLGEAGGERTDDVVAAKVEAEDCLGVEAVGQVHQIHAAQAAVGYLQDLQRRVERTEEQLKN